MANSWGTNIGPGHLLKKLSFLPQTNPRGGSVWRWPWSQNLGTKEQGSPDAEKGKWSKLTFLEQELFAYNCCDVVEASLKGLGHVGDMGEQEQAGAKESSPEQKGFKSVRPNKAKETAHKATHALGGHSHARSGLDEFCIPHQVEETHLVVN